MAEPTVSESIRIDAPAGVIYDLVSDVARMGEWSPEATGARVKSAGAALKVGDRFTGTNKHGLARWSTQCTVTEADRGKAFEFAVAFKPFKISTWRYEFVADGDATVVTEEWTDEREFARGIVIKAFGQVVIPGSRLDHNLRNIQLTLANLKAAAEAV
ncbi:MAG: SRPBCC family protein [Candidatus Nanopelagicales bacterium]